MARATTTRAPSATSPNTRSTPPSRTASSQHIGSVEKGKLADLVLWTPAFFGVKPDLIIKGGAIAAALMGDPNASIPTPQPVHYRQMFRSHGRALHGASLTFVSEAALKLGLARKLKVQRRLVAVKNTRGKIGKKSMIHNGATPKIEIDPETYDVRADGELLDLRAGGKVTDGAAVFFVLRGWRASRRALRHGRACRGHPRLCHRPTLAYPLGPCPAAGFIS